jgi:DNA polymerase V
MADANIHSGDILVVDRSIEASSGKIVVAVINGEFTVKRFVLKGNAAFLMPENPKYPALKIEAGSDFRIWGVVTFVIHKA